MSVFDDNEILVGTDGNRYKIKKYASDKYLECEKCALYNMRTVEKSCAQLLPELFGSEIKRRAAFLKRKSCKTLFGPAYFVRLENHDAQWKIFLKEKEDIK